MQHEVLVMRVVLRAGNAVARRILLLFNPTSLCIEVKAQK